MLIIVAIFIALAILGPLFGADSRDGRDWKPDFFRSRRDPPSRSADSPERPSAARAAVERPRKVRAAC